MYGSRQAISSRKPPARTRCPRWTLEVACDPLQGLGACELIGITCAHAPPHPLGGSQGVLFSRFHLCCFWTDHPLLNLTVKPQPPSHITGLRVTRHRIRGSRTEGTCPRPTAQSAEGEVGRTVQRRGPSRALCSGSSLRPRAPWGSTGPPPDPQGSSPLKHPNSTHQARLPHSPHNEVGQIAHPWLQGQDNCQGPNLCQQAMQSPHSCILWPAR